jgi:hypothetical protein
MKNLNEPVQYSYNTEFTSKNTFMLIKQELRRYEKELELKAGKGIVDANMQDYGFQQAESMFSNQTEKRYDNNIKEDDDE